MIPELEKTTLVGLENLYFSWHPFFSMIQRVLPEIKIAVHGGNVRDIIRCHKPNGDIDMIVMEESLDYMQDFKFYLSNTMGFCPIKSEIFFQGTNSFSFGGKRIELGVWKSFFDFSNSGDYTISSVRFLNDYRIIAHKKFFEDLENRILRPANDDIKIHRIMKSYSFEEDGYRRCNDPSICNEGEAIVFDVREIFDKDIDIKCEKTIWISPHDPSVVFFNVNTYPMGFVKKVNVFIGNEKIDMTTWGVSESKQDLWHIKVPYGFNPSKDVDLIEMVDWQGKVINC